MRHPLLLVLVAAAASAALAPAQMQSRAVDTRVALRVRENAPRATLVGTIPVKPGFTYRFNEPPGEFSIDGVTGEIRTNVELDREKMAQYDLVVLSSQPTYPIEVRVVVEDVNDNPPLFPEEIITVSFSESARPGTRVLLDAATDLDEGINTVIDDYRIESGDNDKKFKLIVTSASTSTSPSYLHLETTGRLDRELHSHYTLNISARDGGTPQHTGYLQVNVTILDANDNPPIFDHSDYTVSLDESSPPGTPVLKVAATDSDIGDNSRVSYYLPDGERRFSVDPETGEVTTTETLKCNRACVFTVYARDHGTPRQDGRAYVTVNLLDANDHDPIIKFGYLPANTGYATVDENAANDSVVAAVSVVDQDEGPNGETDVKIISGNELNNFRLEHTKSFDIVRVNGILDREQVSKYNLTVVATDKGTPPRSSTAFLIILVNDVNDHEPVFEKSEYSAVLTELAPPGSYVAGITATDEDTGVNAQIHYAFVSGNENNWFDIDVDTGLITTKSALDREIQGTVELNISARDGGPNPKWAHTQLKVTILDENDESPEFTQSEINVSLSESTPKETLVAMLTASDHDQGTNGSVSYSLHPDTLQKYKDTFALDSLSGQLVTKTKLDRETISEYEIKIVAKDQGIPSKSSTATVSLNVLDINDNFPEFYPLKYFVPVSENLKIGTSILKVTATDKDIGDNAMITYEIENAIDNYFSIDKWTGVINLKESLKSSSKPIYKLKISAKDHGEKKAIEDATVEIVKASYMEELHFDNYGGYEFKILEDHGDNISFKKREVGTVRVRNSDAIYSIIFGDPNNNFQINEKTGVISTAKKIDREKISSYTLTVVARVELSYGKTMVNIIIDDLNDNKPMFSRDKVEIRIPENTGVGQEIYLARARDLDFGINSKISYSLTYNQDVQFRISEITGVIYLNKPIRSEPNTLLKIEITAIDGGDNSLSSKHIVDVIIEDVNDHTPVFDHTSYETSLLESTPVNERFFALAATDADSSPNNSRITYEIIEGNNENRFGVFPDGFLYVKKQLDRENRDYYSLTVSAKDCGNPPRSSVVPVVIHVIDENDNSPEFGNTTFSFNLKENEPPDTFVGKLTASDKDIGRNAELIFSLSHLQNDFAIDPKNGFIKTLHMFDRESLVQNTGQNLITLEATVSDNGTPRLKDKVKVNIFITDVNDNAPKFLRTPYKVQISEGSNVGSQVIRLYTNDVDENLNGDVFYKIIKGNVGNKFEIDEATGQITLGKKLDREKDSKYLLTVLAHDASLTQQLSSSTVVTIDVLDENDNSPKFSTNIQQISISEITPVNTELTKFRAIDSDLGINSEISYSITAGNRKDTFHIDQLTGVLYLHKNLDYEELNLYHLNITASDNGNPKLSSTILFEIKVEDSNDNAPAFPNTAIVRQIKENIPIHTPIITIFADDPDSGLNKKVTYSISYQEPDDSKRHFGINPITGVIHTLLNIDRETVDTFRLTVMATDQAEPESSRLSAEKLVTVIVEDLNDNAPIFVSMNAATLPRGTGGYYKEGTTIMKVFARDLDSATNGLVTYELANGASDLFYLDQSHGTLKLKKPLTNPEPTYRLSVKATDEAVQSERKSSEAYVTVIALQENDVGPKFDSDVFSGTVFENEPIGTSILTVSASYHGEEIEYYITNVTGNGVQVDRLFDVDTKLGVVSTAVELDREAGVETFEVEVYAVVVGTKVPKTSRTKVRITVLDKNDSPPSFKDTPIHLQVSEDLGPGQSVAVVKAEDPDSIGDLEYSIIKGDHGHFALEGSTGVLRLLDSLDRETKDVYKLLVRCSDVNQHSDTIVTIEVTDTNDNPPSFLETAYSFDIPENAPRGSKVGQIKAVDPDTGVNSQLTYTVISDWANDVFSLNPQTGVFTLTSKLDYEEVQHYILVVQAQDSGHPSLSSTLTVYCNVLDLNDNAPLFDPMSYTNEIFENVTVGTSVVTVSATDLDSGDNGRISYSISSGDQKEDFSIAENGTISTKKSLDRETVAMYNLVVSAADQASPPERRLSSTVQVTIILKDVNDMSPEFITPTETSVAENIPVNTVVMAIKALDKDEGRNGYIEYSLSNDPVSNGVFSLGPIDGLLRVSGRIDREIKSTYTLVVTAKDRGDPPRMTQSNVLVNILDENDNSPVFDPKQYSASIPENASIGASVLQVSATDIDFGANGRVRYSISSGDANRDFNIAEDSGVIRVAKNLNYERKSRYLITVKAEDCADDISGESKSDIAEVSISVSDINDNPPTFLDSPYLVYVTENVIPPNGGYIVTVEAYDADTPPFNNLVRYFIKEGDTDIFKINASSGYVSLLRALDREIQDEYVLSLAAMDTVKAEDCADDISGESKSDIAEVSISVSDINDNPPTFLDSPYLVYVTENVIPPNGGYIVTVEAYDADTPPFNNLVRYFIKEGDTDIFKINASSGYVSLLRALDREIQVEYVLSLAAMDTVKAEDCADDISGESKSDITEVSISVSDINDNPPTFLDSPYLVYVTENVIPPNGGYIVTVEAYDADTPPFNNLVRYFIKEEDTDIFKINASSGYVSLLRALDREIQDEYVLSLAAMDTGSPPLTSTGTLHIIVQDVNDHSPEFKRQSYYAKILENSPSGTWVLTAIALDKDTGLNSKIKYSLLGDKVERFKIDSESGVITTSVSLDREETSAYYFTLIAQDSSPTEPRATAVNLTVIVEDENDNSPVFESSKFEVYISDKTKSNEFVFGAHATDKDQGNNSKISYYITGEHSKYFTINSYNGVIKASQDLSKASTAIFNLEIEAKDNENDPRTTSAELKVFLKPDHLFPRFHYQERTPFVLPENIEDEKIITKLKATSPKKGTLGEIRYSIAGGNIGQALKIDSNSGEIRVVANGLDYETSHQYEVWVEAQDSDSPPLRSVLQLTVNVTDANDNAPVMRNALYNATVMEEELPPLLVVKVTADDIDSGKNGEVSYKLLDDFDGIFEIDGNSGEIYTNTRLDREEIANYELTAVAVDNGEPELSGTATIIVVVLDKNDNPPRFTRLFSVNVTENSEIGSFVIRVTSSDMDIGENANATYTFAENPGDKFKIDPISGNVTVTGHLDREQQDEYLLKVAATDGAWRSETPLTITIQDQNDNSPEFEHSYYSFNFPELQRDIVFVGQVTATDRDKQGPNSVISYSFQQPSDLFTVDPASGEIFSKRSLRYKYTQLENSPENMYTLTILATDNGKPPMSSECLVTINIVDANNNAPKFEKSEYLSPVLEDAKEGQQLLKVVAEDKLDVGVNAEIEYSIVGGNSSRVFTVDKNTGWISLTSKVSGVGTVYNLRIQATDKGVPPQSDTTTVTIIVTGENKYTPVFKAVSYRVLVPENEPLGSTILTVNASDNDFGPNGMIRYEISSGNERKQFGIDEVLGTITILQPLDYDVIQEYQLNITAYDLGFKPRKSTAVLTITLTDINDNSPTFNQSNYDAYISENMPEGTLVYEVVATDIDSPKNAIIQYSISDGKDKEFFKINKSNGRVTSRVSFDYEEKSLYTLKIVASNPDSTMYGTTTMKVHITGINEYYPRFIQPVFHFDVSESTEVGTKIGTISATDQDSGDDGKVYYLLVGSSNDKGFVINSETGAISVSRSLDRETQSRIVLTVMAKNFGGIRGNDTDEAQVIVTVQDGNDPPEFLEDFYTAEISEGVSIGTKVISVKAVDKDVRSQNNQFSYSIIGGNVDQSFKVDPQSGEIQTSRELDRENVPVYSLIIGAIDTGAPPQTGTTLVKINVGDINDNGPIFDPIPIGKVLENEPANTKVMTLSAKDPDLPPNGAPFTYKLIGGKHSDYVKIDKHSGVVLTTKIIDRESTPELNIIVQVEDSGSPKMRSQHNIKILVLDENDSPSTSRSVHVIVYAFNGIIPIGKIADVHPNDADLTGDYRCKILQKPSVVGVLSIPSSCNLHTSKITPGQGYSLSVSGNDGKHQDVVSIVTVEFVTFDNTTVENSVAIFVPNMTASYFLSTHYRGLLESIKNVLSRGDTLILYSLFESEGNLELTLAVKSNGGYKSKFYTQEKLQKKRDTLINLFQNSDIKIGYSPCSDNTCENGGICTENISVKKSTQITDSQNIIFTSPMVVREFQCQCVGGFTGPKCSKREDPCNPNPCKSGGQCRRQGFTFQCVCPHDKDGRNCELEKSDACSNSPCQNGGSCHESSDGSSFFCLCRSGYRGNRCEILADSCRPNPCLHGGLCVSLKPGYKCSCTDGRYGRHCEKSSFGFNELSYMAFPPLDAATNDITFTFSTTKSNSLLIYNYGLQTGGRSDFVAIELLNGKAVFSFGGARTPITSVRVGGNYADGNWYKITATRNGKVISLSVGACSEHGDSCEDCRPGDVTCYSDDTGPTGTLSFNGNHLLVGGLDSADPILERPDQIHSDDFIGCVHSVSVNGRFLNLTQPIRSENIENKCIRQNSCTQPSLDQCGDFGTCIDHWSTSSCVCGNNLLAPNCNNALNPISVSSGGYIEFIVSKKHKRMQLLEHLYLGSSVWTKGVINKRSVVNESPLKSISLMFRTVKKSGILFYSSSNKHYTSVELVNGQMVYISRLSTLVNMTSNDQIVTDGMWHNLTLKSFNRDLEMLLDGIKIGEQLDSVGVHDFLDPYLTYISLGGAQRNMYHVKSDLPESFEGCFANFSINNEIQPFNGSGTIFKEVFLRGKVTKDCNGLLGPSAASTDPLSIGITLVIVFFVVLLVAILVSFVVFRLRKQYKEKSGAPNSTKQNGGPNSNGLNSTDNMLSRGMHNDNTMAYHAEGDVIRGIGGHSLVAPELLAKKYKEREGEVPRPQRPDIIEREVLGKNRDDHLAPLPPSNNHDHGNNDLNSEVPEHYDLENASSIAPSDIDIVYHYKGYREAGGVRKYKAAPPPAAAYHHKHSPSVGGRAPHRHATGFVPRTTPTTGVSGPGSVGGPRQTTPLARLSPSSELSAQQPRILTLHDISGKPLQSALLATTSSSGCVGKDALHSASERSLNSPALSQLSGRSSAGRRPAPAPAPSDPNRRARPPSLVSTLGGASSSSGGAGGAPPPPPPPAAAAPEAPGSAATDESGDDSFTCSEVEYDDASLGGDKPQGGSMGGSASKSRSPPPYDGFDSSYRGSMSTLMASDDEPAPPYRPPGAGQLPGWDYLLNWGPNFESLAGVFKDIAELPDSVNGRVAAALRLSSGPKPSEEYV